MLELRPNCERCNCDLPADSTEAMICTYECTFCVACVETHLHNVCPNCGGGFERRPVRPARAHREGLSTVHQVPSKLRIKIKYSDAELVSFINGLKDIAPEKR